MTKFYKLIFFLSFLLPAFTMESLSSTFFYIGTYINPNSPSDPSVFFYELTPEGDLNLISSSNAGDSPSYMTVSEDNEYCYIVNEMENYQQENSGAVATYKIKKEDGKIIFLNRVSSKGAAPCHISLSGKENFAMVSNYNAGRLCVFPIDPKTRKITDTDVLILQHTGSGPNKERQESAHAHSCFIDPLNEFAFSVDLGTDSVFVYQTEKGKPTLHSDPVLIYKEIPGSGPRHLVFNKAGDVIYVVSELDNTVSVLVFDRGNKVIKRIQKISTLPSDFKGISGCAAIRISSDGKFVYVSNRGHDSIAVFGVKEDHQLSLVGIFETKGKHPRDFNFDLTERFLVVACRDDNVVNIFRRNKVNGTLEFTGKSVRVEKPVNVCMLNRGN